MLQASTAAANSSTEAIDKIHEGKWRTVISALSCVAAAVNVVCWPFVQAFIGRQCFSTRNWWAFALVVCDVFLWLEVLCAIRFAWRKRSAASRTRGITLVADAWYWLVHILRVLCLLPWDWLTEHDGGAPCYSTAHLSRCFFMTYLYASAAAAMNRIFPALGPERAGMQLVLLIGNSIAMVHWYG